MKYIQISVIVTREGEYYLSKCPELGTASLGATEQEAIDNALDAALVYLNTLEDLGECDRALREKGIIVREGPSIGQAMRCPPSGQVRTAAVPLPVSA